MGREYAPYPAISEKSGFRGENVDFELFRVEDNFGVDLPEKRLKSCAEPACRAAGGTVSENGVARHEKVVAGSVKDMMAGL